MDLKTFFGAINKEVISQIAISKSIWGNLKSLWIWSAPSSGEWATGEQGDTF
jgi:hypothetical protein